VYIGDIITVTNPLLCKLFKSRVVCTVGFLPTETMTRRKKLEVVSKQTATQIFYVPPHKLRKILDDCVSAFGASR
jgi:16S rRNA (cytidine1402-2'-O)-methyltransferase